jgi:hypothetical protein
MDIECVRPVELRRRTRQFAGDDERACEREGVFEFEGDRKSED